MKRVGFMPNQNGKIDSRSTPPLCFPVVLQLRFSCTRTFGRRECVERRGSRLCCNGIYRLRCIPESCDAPPRSIHQSQSIQSSPPPTHTWSSPISDSIGTAPTIHFVPMSAPVDRGIFATVFVSVFEGFDLSSCFTKYYEEKPFIRIRQNTPELRFVRGSGFADIATHQQGTSGVVLVAIDNLGKGASSQAIQATNLSYGFPETSGLLSSPLPLWENMHILNPLGLPNIHPISFWWWFYFTRYQRKRILGLLWGHAVTLIGNSHPKWANAISKQAHLLGFCTTISPLSIRSRVAERLCSQQTRM